MSVPVKIYRTVTYQEGQTPSNPNLSGDPVVNPINPNGGAIAIGHPLGVSGARIVGSAAMELQKQDKKYALCTLCIGVGQGYAMVIEKV